MANDVKLEVLTFKIRENKSDPQDKQAPLPLKDISGNDFFKLFLEYLSTIDTDLEVNEGQQKAIRLQDNSLVSNSGKRIVSGVFESGHYGYESEFENIKTKAKKKEARR